MDITTEIYSLVNLTEVDDGGRWNIVDKMTDLYSLYDSLGMGNIYMKILWVFICTWPSISVVRDIHLSLILWNVTKQPALLF